MDLRQALTRSFAVAYPGEAAGVLEPRAPEEVAGVLRLLPPDTAASVLERMAPVAAARVVEQFEVEDASNIFVRMTFEAALTLLRRLTTGSQESIVKALPKEHADAVSAVIGFPQGTAGALMDPRVLAVPSDLTVDDAVKALRRDAAYSHYNLYVIDRDRVLVGVLNIHELLLANPRDRLGTIMILPQHRLDADADRQTIVNHPGWRQVHSLPVVDRNGRFLGAIRYRAFRRLEAEIRGDDAISEVRTAQALGDLFGTGFGGLIDAIASAVSPRRGAGSGHGAGSGDGGQPGPDNRPDPHRK